MERTRRVRASGAGWSLLASLGLAAAAVLAACAPALPPAPKVSAVAGPELPAETDPLYRLSLPGFPAPAPAPVALPAGSEGYGLQLYPGDGTPPVTPYTQVGHRSSPYDCDGLHPTWFTALHPATKGVAEFHAAIHPESPESLEPSAELDQAFLRVAALDPARLLPFERIVVQNTALSAALRLPEQHPLAIAARSEVKRFALSAAALDALGDGPSQAIERWIGPVSEITDRKGDACGDGRLLLHDRQYSGVRAFRPVRVGGALVLFSQLVALDDEGHPHVTPVIGQMEIRRGTAAGAPVCIVEIASDALASGLPGGLRPAAYDELVTTPFVRHHGEGALGCFACHTGHGIGDFADVPSNEAASLMTNRHHAALDLAARRTEAFFRAEASGAYSSGSDSAPR